MIKRAALAFFLLCFAALPARADVVVGQPAPDFTGLVADDSLITLSKLKGKTVVLEWHNMMCPFVRKHYVGLSMQAMQQKAKDDGVVWLTVNSAASGEEGYIEGYMAQKVVELQKFASAAYLIDEPGIIGRLYGAKNTPYMVVIDKEGVVAYKGAIDSIPSTDEKDVPKAVNYVQAALDALKAGKPVDPADTPSYGCSVKYRTED